MAGTTDPAGDKMVDVAHALQGLRPRELHNLKQSPSARHERV